MFNSKRFTIIKKAEKQVEIAKLFFDNSVVSEVRDKLEGLNKSSQFMPENFHSAEEYYEEQTSNPTDSLEILRDHINKALAKGYANASIPSGDDDETLFDVEMDYDNNIITVKSKNPIGNDKFNEFDNSIYASCLNEVIDSLNVVDDYRTEVKNSVLQLLDDYRYSFQSNERERGLLRLTPNEDTEPISHKIFEVLKGAEIESAKSSDKLKNDPMSPTGVTTMSSNKYNLKKQSDKIFDSIREKEIVKTDPQYNSRHKDAIPEYDKVYVRDDIWKDSVMDKYTPERVNPETGEYEGGYLEDRFHVHKNTEGNSMRARPDGKVPDRPENYNLERRLEEMRANDNRGYSPTRGEKAEAQSKNVYAEQSADYNISKDFGVYRISQGSKVLYVNTDEEVETFKRLAKLGPVVNLKKKIATPIELADASAEDIKPVDASPNPYRALYDSEVASGKEAGNSLATAVFQRINIDCPESGKVQLRDYAADFFSSLGIEWTDPAAEAVQT